MKKIPATQWFVEPLDDASNGMVVQALEVDQTEIALAIIRDDAGEPHNLWQALAYRQIEFLRKSARNLAIHFRVWERQNNQGPVHLAPSFAQPYQKRRKAFRLKKGSRSVLANRPA